MALLLKDFTEIEKRGEGTMGECFAATQISLNRKVILKKIPQSLFKNLHQFERFENAARLAASLNHDNLVHIYDFGRNNNTLYFAMEYIDGMDFETVLDMKPFLREIGLMIALLALKGLQFAHRQGMVHGGFNPTNILISKTGMVKVAIAGLAYLNSQALCSPAEVSRFIAPEYLSPEEATRIEEIHPSSNILSKTMPLAPKLTLIEENPEIEDKNLSRDIWSAGVLLYRIICGKLPFSGETFSGLMQSIIYSNEQHILHCMPFLPDDCAVAISACLAKESQNRLSSLDTLIASLEFFIYDMGVHDIEKEIQKYMADKNSACSGLEKVLFSYHTSMTGKYRKSGDTVKAATHFAEVERLGRNRYGIIQPVFITPADPPVKTQATKLFLDGKKALLKKRPLFLTSGTGVLYVASAIIIAFIAVGCYFTMLQKNRMSWEVWHIYLQKSKNIDRQTPPSQQVMPKPVFAVSQNADPTRVAAVAPVRRFQREEAKFAHIPDRKNVNRLNRIKNSAGNPVSRPESGTFAILKVTVKPSAAVISLDRKEVSPQDMANGKRVMPGPHVITARASGFTSYQSTFVIEAGVTQIVDISLTQIEKGTGLLHVYSYPSSTLYVDGVLQGTTPTPKPLTFLEGEHTLLLQRPGFASYKQSVHLLKGQLMKVQIELEKVDKIAEK